MTATCSIRPRLLLFLTWLCSCSGSGEVQVEFRLPEDPDLAPASINGSQITLVTRNGSSTSTETRRLDDRSEALAMGNVPVGEGIDLAVELRAPNQRLVGYARAPGPVDIAADAVTIVPMNVRRPFVYVSGDTAAVSTYDSTQNTDAPNQSYIGSITLARSPRAVSPTSDGGDLVVVSVAGNGGELSLVSTSTHTPAPVPPVPISGDPIDAAVTHDNRFVVVGHAGGANGGVSIVDLEAARAGQSSVQFHGLGGAVGVVVAGRGDDPEHPGRAFGLIDRAITAGCPTQSPPASRIAVIDLGDPSAEPLIIDPGGPIHDIAVSPDGRGVYLADSCRNRIERRDIVDDAQSGTVTNLVDASAVAVFDDRVWAVGTAPPSAGKGARLVVVSMELDGSNQTRVEMQPSQELAIANDFTQPGQVAESRMDADALIAFEIAVAPGGDHLALLVWGYFHGDQSGDFLGSPIIPEMQMVTNEYFLLDADSAAVVQRVRASCELVWVSDPFNPPILDDWDCSRAPDQDVASTPYIPAHLSILYGAR